MEIKNEKELRKSIDQILLQQNVIFRLLYEINKGKQGFNETKFARLLHSMGIPPTDIARILGKNKASEVSAYLYSKKKK